MKLVMVGTGYVGLVSGVCFAEFGHSVTCVDTDESKIAALRDGQVPIYEPGLEDLLRKNVSKNRLHFTSEGSEAIRDADVVFIAVGTPVSRRGSGYADMQYVFEAAKSIAKNLSGFTVIVNKSTVPVGSAREVARLIREVNPQADFEVASNPEFLREGAAVRDFTHPDRIIVGVDSGRAKEVMQQVYGPLTLREAPLVFFNPETAELTKYASNAFLAMKISFINEMANLCESVGANIQDLAKGIGMDGRIGSKFLHAGPGYGGSCFPKDTMALLRIAQESGQPTRLIETVVEVNNAQKARMVKKIRDALGDPLAGKSLAVLGLSFKPETDDMRDAPALMILPALQERGVKIRAHDPVAMDQARPLLPGVEFCDDPYMACEGADAVCLMTEWNPYRALDLKRIKSLLRHPTFIDLRNVYRVALMQQQGFDYVGVGQ